MNDLIGYAAPVKIARAGATLSALDSHTAAAKILVCSGEPRSGLAAALPDAVLVSFELPKPAGFVNDAAELVLGNIPDAMITAAGTAAWAQLQTGSGVPIANLSVGLPGSGAAIMLSSVALDAGSLLRITAAKLIEP